MSKPIVRLLLACLGFGACGFILVAGFLTAFPPNRGQGPVFQPDLLKAIGTMAGLLLPLIIQMVKPPQERLPADESDSRIGDLESSEPIELEARASYWKQLATLHRQSHDLTTQRLRTATALVEKLRLPSRTRYAILAMVLYAAGAFVASAVTALVMSIAYPGGTSGVTDMPWYLNTMYTLLLPLAAAPACFIAARSFHKQQRKVVAIDAAFRIGGLSMLTVAVLYFSQNSPEDLGRWAEVKVPVLWLAGERTSLFILNIVRMFIVLPLVGFASAYVAMLPRPRLSLAARPRQPRSAPVRA